MFRGSGIVTMISRHGNSFIEESLRRFRLPFFRRNYREVGPEIRLFHCLMTNPFRFRILDRYLAYEVLRPFLATGALFILLFGSYSSADLLADAVAGELPMDIVGRLIGLKVLIALEVLLPIALYLSVVLGLGRLYNDAEMTAMAACGYSEGRIAGAVLRLALVVAVIVACLSMLIRPWAYQQSYALRNRAEAQFDIDKLEPGRFHSSETGGYVIFAEAIERRQERLEKVFFNHPKGDDKLQTIYAQSLNHTVADDGRSILEFHDGYAYNLDLEGRGDAVLRFQSFTLVLAGVPEPVGYKSKAAGLTQLWQSQNPKDIAELQWRLLRPVSTLLLALLAVPLSHTAPRQGRYAKTIVAILLFALYYNLTGVAKTWVKEGVVGPVPGVWWPDLLLLLLVCAWYAPAMTAWWRSQHLLTQGQSTG